MTSTKATNTDYDFMFTPIDSVNTEKAPLTARLKDFICNRQTWGFLISVAVMAIISLAFFYPDNIEGNDLRQSDMLQGLANGQEISQFHDATGETSRWTNSLFSGMPTFQISPAYPSDSLFRWITTVYGLGLPSPSNLLFMMMVGFMILMLAMNIRWEYGLIGAVAWGFSTYFVIIIGAGHIWKFVTLAYIPPTIAGIILAYRGRYLAGGAMAALFAMMQLCSNHVQMTYYFMFLIIGLVIAYLYCAIKARRMRRWWCATGVLALAAILAVGANSPNLYHTWKYAAETQRATSELSDSSAKTEQSKRDYITQYSYGRVETLSLFIPDIKGGASARPEGGQMVPMSLARIDKADKYAGDPYVSLYLNYSSQYFGEPEGTNGPVYVGALIFALFIVGCIVVKGPMKWTLIVMTLLSVLLALGRNFMPLTDLFIDIVPLYSKFRTPESILVVAEFTIPLMAVLALVKLLSHRDILNRHFKPVAITFGILAAICLLAIATPGLFGEGVDMERETQLSQMLVEAYSAQGVDPSQLNVITINNPSIYNAIEDLHFSMVRADALRSLIILALGFAILAMARLTKVKSAWCVAAVGLIVFADLYNVDMRYISTDSFYKGMKTSAGIPADAIDNAILQDTDMNYRVADFDNFGGYARSYRHKMVGGYHAAKLGRYQDLIDRGLIAAPHVLDMLNTRYLIYDGQVERNDYALGNAWIVDHIDYVDTPAEEIDILADLDPSVDAVADARFEQVLGKASAANPDDYIYETSYAPNRLTYKADLSKDAVVVFSEIYFPWGWKATIDGNPAEIGRVNYILRAMRIPAGVHDIEMVFDPDSIHVTTAIATVCIILIYLSVIAAITCRFVTLPKRRK